jgi:hypothetical protein
MNKKLTVRTEVEFDATRLNDLLCCALEGGSNYWYMIHDVSAGKAYYDAVPYSGGWIMFTACGDDGEYNFQHHGETQFKLNWVAMVKGINIMANAYPYHFANFLAENEDAETGDVFLQCCLFGEIIFG